MLLRRSCDLASTPHDPVSQPNFPAFDCEVPDGGYQWWYVDGTSDDHKHHIVMIAFVGSVFSPHYFKALGTPQGKADQFCAFNLGVYSKLHKRWVLTEYDSARSQRDATRFEMGRNRLHYDGTALHININDRSMPFARPVKGQLRIEPMCQTQAPLTLHKPGQQHWWPFAPAARIELDLPSPGLKWKGKGYFDTNWGAVPLQDCFKEWHWSRQHIGTATRIAYHSSHRSGAGPALALNIHKDGRVEDCEVPPVHELPKGLWQMRRPIATLEKPTLVRTLEDTPFYTRSIVATPSCANALAMHESLSLERFVQPWVQRLLPFRTRR